MLTYRQQQRLLNEQVDAVEGTCSAQEDLDDDDDDELECDALPGATATAAATTAAAAESAKSRVTGNPPENARAWYAAAAASLAADAPQERRVEDDAAGTDSDAAAVQFDETRPPAAAAAAAAADAFQRTAAAVAQRSPAESRSWRTEPTAVVRGSPTAAAALAVPRAGTAGSVDEVSFDTAAATKAQHSAQPPRARSHAATAANGITQPALRKRPAVTPPTAFATATAAAAAAQSAADSKRSRTSLPAAAVAVPPVSAVSSVPPVPAAMTSAATATAARHTTGNASAAAAATAAAVVSKQTADSMSANGVRDYMRGANTELMANESVSRAFAKLLFECHSAVEDAYSVSHGGEQRASATAAAVTAAEAAAAAMVAESRDRTDGHRAAEQSYLCNASNRLLAADSITLAYKHSLDRCYWAIMKQLI
jgi:trimeric autotransporter adhesin